ncbi:CBS domain-containing protein [Kutzneria kofuensis]|uniref:CBS domain-containing protein n=1 Tax=Kutzneria kofuensis TaxID=103725 RepID=UPI003CD09496
MARTLAEYRISAVPVIDDSGRVTGVVSEADLIRKEEMRGGLDHLLSHHAPGAEPQGARRHRRPAHDLARDHHRPGRDRGGRREQARPCRRAPAVRGRG